MVRRAARRRIITSLACTILLSCATAWASHTWQGTFTRFSLPPGAIWPARDYYVYVPPTLAPEGERSLVVYLHGCTQTATEAALGVRWNEFADERGFVVVYPEQRVAQDPTDFDGNPGRCWNWGQPAVYPREQGEIASVAEITKTVAIEHAIDPGRIYVAGTSAGAGMATTMAASYPDLYAASASIAGAPYLLVDVTGVLAYQRMGVHARVVPTIVFFGTADPIAFPVLGPLTEMQWVGTNDLADDGAANGSVSRLPASIENVGFDALAPSPSSEACLQPYRFPCLGGALGRASYPYTVLRHTGADGSVIVEAWIIYGLSHAYPGGNPEGTFVDPTGPDVTRACFEFFASHARTAE
jgi:poly(hydroxyalkanoate) depolymerase family esterase